MRPFFRIYGDIIRHADRLVPAMMRPMWLSAIGKNDPAIFIHNFESFPRSANCFFLGTCYEMGRFINSKGNSILISGFACHL